MPLPYGEIEGEPTPDSLEPQIIGQVSGPLSWTEDRIEAENIDMLDPRNQFGRQNGTSMPRNIPHPTSGPRSLMTGATDGKE